MKQVRIGRRRVTELESGEHHFEGRYKGRSISIEREGEDDNWYIVVHDDDGRYAYDGWWPDSYDSPLNDAIAEAIKGAML